MSTDAVYRSYYTKSDPLVSYMVSNLDLKPGHRVLEPCAGDGVFVDAVLDSSPDVTVDAYELNPEAIALLDHQYRADPRVTVQQADTLTDANLTFEQNLGAGYDRIIGNPPYGGWQDYEKRDELKKMYPGFYVKETYGLFMSRCVALLKNNGKLVFIVPDTFLNLHMHTPLRRFLLLNCHLEEVAVFPSSFFPGVRYGYAKMSIVTLRRVAGKTSNSDHVIRVLTNLKTPDALLNGRDQHRHLFRMPQRSMFNNIDHALFISEDNRIATLINESPQRIGDVAACVTGLYTGNDRNYVRPVNSAVRSASRYEALNTSDICGDYLDRKNILDGLHGKRRFIPIMKGGRTRYFKEDNWYIDWSAEAVHEYKTHRKARFQNSKYYFGDGIGVPMVSSTAISAALLKQRVFDQAIVGIFPENREWLYYLLALFNSPTCNTLIRTINPSANNSANYIKKIPFVVPSAKCLREIDNMTNTLVDQARNTGEYDQAIEDRLQSVVADLYGF